MDHCLGYKCREQIHYIKQSAHVKFEMKRQVPHSVGCQRILVSELAKAICGPHCRVCDVERAFLSGAHMKRDVFQQFTKIGS